jgi:phosphotransferase family enzyme
MHEAEGVPLPGGRMTSGLVRHGDRVRRPTGPWSPAVHEYLRHLASAGFEGSPRVLATGDGWEDLTYIDGEVAADPDWQPGRGNRLPPQARTDRALAGAGRLLRALHEAAAGFEPAVTTYRFHPHPPLPGEVVSHGDLGPWNTVYQNGVPVAFIDWDAAQPVDPLTELADAAWTFVPLAPPGLLAEAGFDPLPDLPARLRTFLDTYGLAGRKTILPALEQTMSGEPERLRWLQHVSPDLTRAL